MNREEIIAKVVIDTSSSGTEVTQICQDKIDWIQEDICSRYDFNWLKEYGYITTIPIYETGSVSITQDSATVTGSGTTFTESMEGRLIKFGTEDNWYEILNYVSATEITLSSNYIGTTDTNSTYCIYKVDYPLASDFKKMHWVKQIITPAKLIPIPEGFFNQYYPDMFIRGEDVTPDSFFLTGIDASGYYTINFSPIQTTRKQFYYCYTKQLPSINTTGGTSKIPTKWHEAIVFMLDVFVFNMIDIPQKANFYNNLYEQTIARMVSEDIKRDKSLSYIMGRERLGRDNNTYVVFDPSHFDN
jgi:hypothetical protein